jgi:hypothetical protein
VLVHGLILYAIPWAERDRLTIAHRQGQHRAQKRATR